MLCALGWLPAGILLFSLFISLCLAIKIANDPGRRYDDLDGDLDVPEWASHEHEHEEVK
jgi:hypothetical protein